MFFLIVAHGEAFVNRFMITYSAPENNNASVESDSRKVGKVRRFPASAKKSLYNGTVLCYNKTVMLTALHETEAQDDRGKI